MRLSPGDALQLIREWLADFPFEGAADFAHTLALLLTPQLRGLIDGPVPMTVIEAPAAGTGKSLLAEVVAAAAAQLPVAAGGQPARPQPSGSMRSVLPRALVGVADRIAAEGGGGAGDAVAYPNEAQHPVALAAIGDPAAAGAHAAGAVQICALAEAIGVVASA